jgi:hypothetical protein
VQLNLHAYEGNSGSAKITHELKKCDLESIWRKAWYLMLPLDTPNAIAPAQILPSQPKRFYAPSQNAQTTPHIKSGSSTLIIQILIQERLHHLAHFLRLLIHLALSLILSNSSQRSEKPHLFQFSCQLEEIFCCSNLNIRFRQPGPLICSVLNVGREWKNQPKPDSQPPS